MTGISRGEARNFAAVVDIAINTAGRSFWCEEDGDKRPPHSSPALPFAADANLGKDVCDFHLGPLVMNSTTHTRFALSMNT